MRIALSFSLPVIEVDNAILNRALSLLSDYELRATLFLSLGTGEKRWFRRGKSTRHQVVADRLARLSRTGHELCVSPNEPERWIAEVLQRDKDWVQTEMHSAQERFHTLLGRSPEAWASPDQRINADVPLLEADLGFRYGSDTRGLTPFLARTVAGTGSCPQIPVTLPSFEELRAAGVPSLEWDQYLFMESQKPLLAGHVFRCDLTNCEPAWLDGLEKLIVMWKGSQWDFSALGEIAASLDLDTLPTHEIGMLRLNGMEMAAQGPECHC